MENIKDKNQIEDDDICDLDPNKICDNCCKCIEETANFKSIKITKIIKEYNNDKTI